jgi:molecular chaperone DnaK
MVHMVKKSLTEYGDKLDAAEKATIEAAIKDVEDVLREGDKEVITAKTEALSQAAQKLGEKMYAQQQAESAAPAGGADAGAQQAKKDEGDVVDAEFTEVKDKK